MCNPNGKAAWLMALYSEYEYRNETRRFQSKVAKVI